MARLVRLRLFALLLVASTLGAPSDALRAQGAEEPEEQGPAAFIPSEELSADSAVSFPVDI